MKVEEGNQGGVLVDNFIGHSTGIVKNNVKSFKSDDNDGDDDD